MHDEPRHLGPFARVEAGTDQRSGDARLPLRVPSMKPLMLVGIIVALLGGYVLVKGMTYPSSRSVIKVGDLQASVQNNREIPQWVGIVAVVGGALMIGAGMRGRKA